MAVNIPAAINLHNLSPNADPAVRDQIGLSAKGTKANGNLPITDTAAEWQITSAQAQGGTLFALGGSHDVSVNTKLLVWQYQHNAPNRIQLATRANGGLFVRISSGAGGNVNYRDYTVAGSDLVSGGSMNGINPFVIDLNDSVSPDATAGVFDNTDVQGYGLAQNWANMTGTASIWLYAQRAHLFDTAKNAPNIVKFTGTSDFDDIINEVLGTSFTNKVGGWVQKLSSTYFIPVAFQIGDAATATTFNDGGVTVVSPASNDPTDPRYRLTTQAMRVYVVLPATGSTVTMSGTYVWGTAAPWDLDQNGSSTITIDGAAFNGMGDFVVGSAVTGAANFKLASGSAVISNGANLDGSVITGRLDLDVSTDITDITATTGIYINDPTPLTMTRCTANQVVLTQTADLTLHACEIGQVENLSGAHVNLLLSGGSTVPTLVETSGTLSISFAPRDFTVTGVPAGAEIRIYDNDGTLGDFGTELAGVESHLGGDFVYTHTTPNNDIIVQVMAPGFEEFIANSNTGDGAATLAAELKQETNI